jgi:hypothetical protein
MAASAQLAPAIMAPGLIAFAAPARRSADRAVDKLAATINQGLKSPDLNSSLGRLVAAAKVDRRRILSQCRRGNAELGSDRDIVGHDARLSSRHPRSTQP